MVVVVTILAVIFPIFITMLIGTYKDAFFLDDKVKNTTSSMQALWFMEDNIRISNSFSAIVPSVFSDPYGPHDLGTAGLEAWSYKGDSATGRVLISVGYATTSNVLNTGRQPVFEDTAEFNCTTQMYYQPQLEYVSIYFVKDTTLYRRVLTDTPTTLCAGNTQQQKQSCTPTIPVASRNSLCKANDEILATNVSNFTVGYYQISQDGTSTQLDPTYSSSDTTILDAADYASVSITTSTKNGEVINTLTQRMTKVNQ
jgi:uncharacterized membrane protein YwzB